MQIILEQCQSNKKENNKMPNAKFIKCETIQLEFNSCLKIIINNDKSVQLKTALQKTVMSVFSLIQHGVHSFEFNNCVNFKYEIS